QEAGGRRLGDEGKGTVGIDGDLRRDRRALFKAVGRGVERLAEFHDVDAALTQRRADRRRRIGGAGGHLKVDVTFDLLGHVWPPFSLSPALSRRLMVSGTNGILRCLPQGSP